MKSDRAKPISLTRGHVFKKIESMNAILTRIHHVPKEVERLNTIAGNKLSQLFKYLEQTNRRGLSWDEFDKEFGEAIKKLELDSHVEYYFNDFPFISEDNHILKIKIKDAIISNKNSLSLGKNQAFIEPIKKCRGVHLIFERIIYDDEYMPVDFKFLFNLDEDNNSPENSLFIKNCDFAAVIIEGQSFKYISVDKSAGIAQIKTKQVTEHVLIKNSVVDYINLTNNLESLKVFNSEIKTFDQRWLFAGEGNHSLQFLSFDSLSEISINPYGSYKNLRTVATKLQDRIQAHIFYAKELEAFRNDPEVDVDSKILLTVNRILNNNSLSILKPVFGIILVNAVFVLGIFLNEFYAGSSLGVDYLWQAFNYLPTQDITPKEFGYLSQSLDSFRRLLDGLFIYLIVSSSIRFRFKT